MKQTSLLVTLFLAFSVAFAQGEPKQREVKQVKSTSAPVTHAEAEAVFAKAWKAFETGLKVKGKNPAVIPSDGKPVTKNEILTSFKALVVATKPMFKRSASKVKFDAKRLRKDMDPSYLKLIEDGFVMPVGPLVIGKNGTVSTFEFGDAMGVIMIRIADLTQMPIRKFTPSLMPPN